MSKPYEDMATLSIGGGEERDYQVRGLVDLEMTGRGTQAEFDGSPEVLIGAEWTALEDIDVTADYRESVFDVLSEAAMADDEDQCVDEDDYCAEVMA